MIELNKEYNVKIIDEDNKGNGITRIDNFVIIVPYSLKEEVINIKITKVEKRYAVAKIINIVEPSPYRKKVLCDAYISCGGCSFLHIDYNDEIRIKTNYINKRFDLKIDKSYFGNEYNYRNKANFHIYNSKLGYYSENSHDLVEFNNCLLLDKRINDVYNYINDTDISKLNEVMLRVTSNEIMVNFNGEYNYKELLSKINIDSVYLNNEFAYGKEYIIETINEIKYTIYPESFFQINYDSMKELYNIVKEYSGKGDKLLDLYCGTGSIGMYLKDNFKNITGIEINKSSIDNANINKRINNISNIKFILGDAKKALKDKYDTVIVDPPRSGLSKEVINVLNSMNTNIVYVSCNPDTLKRDIELLSNYTIDKLSIVNMFPKTKHIECVMRLTSKENN